MVVIFCALAQHVLITKNHSSALGILGARSLRRPALIVFAEVIHVDSPLGNPPRKVFAVLGIV